MEPYLEQEFGGGYDEADEADLSPAPGANPLFRRAPSDDARSTAGFTIDDDFPPARQASSSDKRTEGVGRTDKGKSKSRGADVDRQDSLPLPSLQARLAAYPPSQSAPRTSRDAAEASRSSKSQRRSPPRPSGSKPRPTQLSSDSASPSGSSSSGSDDSVDIFVPSKHAKGKKRAVETDSDDDDESDGSSPPARKKSHSKHASHNRRSPSPPLPLGAAGNNYFQGRNLPGLRVSWTNAETDLLIKLLGQIDCNWARMIKLHGPKGTRSTTFKNRTTVALKDKAVNLKMGFMRRGAPVPKYLQNGASCLPPPLPWRPPLSLSQARVLTRSTTRSQ